MREFRVLGPVEAVVDGEPLPIGGVRQRVLLALLLVEPNRPVPADRLIDELWAGEPPDGAETTLRSYVSRLRSALGSGQVIRAASSGYALAVSADTIDAIRFERHVRDAASALRAAEYERARHASVEAQALWRGEPFGGLAQEGMLRTEAERLEELRVNALETRMEAEIALGAAGNVVDELERATQHHPYRERLWRLLMLALYRTERQADALDAFQRARRRLREDLGIEPGDALQELQQQILRHEVPSTDGETPAQPRHNLPAQSGSLVGRAREVADVAELLRQHQLVTLTGVGGVGKTRVALAVAEQALPGFRDGVLFVDLSTVTHGSGVTGQLARLLDLRAGSADANAELARRLSSAERLLVLDNCEHVATACAELVEALVNANRDLRILATSRVPLGAMGEEEFPLPPMEVPSADAPIDEIAANDAVRLLVERARSARRQLTVDDAVLRSAARICRDLDGLPLAIEICGARARALSLDEIAGRLDDRLRFLVSWRRLAPARHQTLRRTMDWSFDLLGEPERRLFAGASVFVGGFSLAAAAAILADGDELAALHLVELLVEASLVVVNERLGTTRYSMLETVRDYAASRLDATDAAPIRAAHARYFSQLAQTAEPELTGDAQADWFARLDDELANLHAALDELERSGAADELVRMTVAMTRFWYVRGYITEARRRLEHVLGGPAADSVLRRRALTAAAAMALIQGNHVASVTFAEQSLEVAQALGDDRLIANGLSNLGAIVLAAGDHARARELLERAVATARVVGDDRILALSLNNLGDHGLTTGELERAEPLLAESLALLRARGDTANIARSLFNLGGVALRKGRIDHARGCFVESLEKSTLAGSREDQAWALLGLAALDVRASDTAAVARGAALNGSAENLLRRMGATFKPFERQLHDETRALAEAALGAEAEHAARERGATMSVSAAVDLALPTV